MRVNCVITPLICEAEDNSHFVEKATKELADYIPKLSHFHNITFNAQSTEMVGDQEVQISTLEKIKCYAGELETGKPAKVTIEFGSYAMNGKHGLTTKIVGTW